MLGLNIEGMAIVLILLHRGDRPGTGLHGVVPVHVPVHVLVAPVLRLGLLGRDRRILAPVRGPETAGREGRISDTDLQGDRPDVLIIRETIPVHPVRSRRTRPGRKGS